MGAAVNWIRPRALIGDTRTGKSDFALVIIWACIRSGWRGRCLKTVYIVNKPDAEVRVAG